jgi:hypothetical protein
MFWKGKRATRVEAEIVEMMGEAERNAASSGV